MDSRLRLAQVLGRAGMANEQAIDVAQAFTEQSVEQSDLNLTEARLSGAIENFSTELAAGLAVMRADMNAGLNRVETGLKADMTKMEAGLKSDVTRLKSDVAQLRTELKSDVAQLRAEAKGVFSQQTVTVASLIAAFVVIAGTVGAAAQFFFSQ